MNNQVCKGCEWKYNLGVATFLLGEEKVKEGYCSHICYNKAHKNHAVSKSASVMGSGVKLSPSFYKAYGSRIFLYIAGRDEFGEPMGTEHSISHNEATRLLAELRKVLP